MITLFQAYILGGCIYTGYMWADPRVNKAARRTWSKASAATKAKYSVAHVKAAMLALAVPIWPLLGPMAIVDIIRRTAKSRARKTLKVTTQSDELRTLLKQDLKQSLGRIRKDQSMGS